MSLDRDDLTNIERGVDAGFDVLLELANRGMVGANSRGDAPASRAFMDFAQSVVAHRAQLADQALQRAMTVHPDLEEEEGNVT